VACSDVDDRNGRSHLGGWSQPVGNGRSHLGGRSQPVVNEDDQYYDDFEEYSSDQVYSLTSRSSLLLTRIYRLHQIMSTFLLFFLELSNCV